MHYEKYHNVRYSDETIECAVRYSSQYISDRFLPDKAIDLIDEAGSAARLRATMPDTSASTREILAQIKKLDKEKDGAVENKDFQKAANLLSRRAQLSSQLSNSNGGSFQQDDGEIVVSETDIASVVSLWTGIPVVKVTSEESDRLTKIEETLHNAIIGQDEAISAIARSLRRCRVGLRNPNRPISSFIFAGPTGVGKSELAKTLASYYFGSGEALIRLDMSEYMERHTVSKLIGSPPGYVGFEDGGQLTEAVRRRPYSVVLFDEIEKAHPDTFNMMLQILDDGRLTDSKGRSVEFGNTLLIMTSNVGSSVIEKGGMQLGFQLPTEDADETSYNRIKTLVNEELKQYFRPEFLNRLDEIIVFRQLTKSEVKEIADIMLKDVFSRTEEKGIILDVTERFKDRLVDDGFNPSFGARPLRRAIIRLVEDPMAEMILGGNVREGDAVILDVNSDAELTVINGDKSYVVQ